MTRLGAGIPAGAFALAVFAAQAWAADPTPSTALWRDARYGMSPAQVQALFPSSRPPAKEDPLLDGSARELLETSDQIEGMPATAAFYFTPAGLKMVIVKVEGPPVIRRSVDALIATFNDRYGKAARCDWPGAELQMGGCYWPAKPVTVTLFAQAVAGIPPSQNRLTVNYYSAEDYQREFGAALDRAR